MEIQQLTIFERVVKEGSFSKAAHKLNYSQSAITQKVKRLEEGLETQLFHRNSTGISLTQDGERFFKYTLEVLEKTNAVITDIKYSKENVLRLRVGCTDIFNASYPDFTATMLEKNRELDLTLELASSEELIKRLLNHTLDAAMVDHDIQKKGLYEVGRFTDFIGVVHHENVIIREWPDVIEKEVLLLNPDCLYRQRMDELLHYHHFISTPVYTKMGSIESILSCVNVDLGIAVLPEKTFERSRDKYQNIAFTPLPISYGSIHHLIVTTTSLKKDSRSLLKNHIEQYV
ncbi:DNA-binding transcriptional LysR family regulator [Salibacterium salarium]|uniref:LysR family transcriptional regulator n=1 Tax=Salibacterium salarium TaxID=284579 RepID=UPI00278A7A77|nr:LysR family transcriptional regulator [Salibacterium salarium]MDQ0300567.1 DNA-binding transcriptional LysR family regulator [Salibacterium salarium]